MYALNFSALLPCQDETWWGPRDLHETENLLQRMSSLPPPKVVEAMETFSVISKSSTIIYLSYKPIDFSRTDVK